MPAMCQRCYYYAAYDAAYAQQQHCHMPHMMYTINLHHHCRDPSCTCMNAHAPTTTVCAWPVCQLPMLAGIQAHTGPIAARSKSLPHTYTPCLWGHGTSALCTNAALVRLCTASEACGGRWGRRRCRSGAPPSAGRKAHGRPTAPPSLPPCRCLHAAPHRPSRPA